jgi:hypothetical protein
MAKKIEKKFSTIYFIFMNIGGGKLFVLLPLKLYLINIYYQL